MKNKKLKKILLILRFTIIVVFIFSQTKTSAAAISITNIAKIWGATTPAGMMYSMLDDYGVNQDELKYDIQTFNVASKKKTPPSVSLSFNPANPEEGEKITVTASPTYFLNDPKDLYYTWFLRSKDCKKKEEGNILTEKERI
jgi:hypothetical protein